MSPVTANEVAPFHHAEVGMTRFPPNVEQINVRQEGGMIWLTARRNDTELRFPLSRDDALHLAGLLADAS